MNKIGLLTLQNQKIVSNLRFFSNGTKPLSALKDNYKLLIIGGGTAGITMSAKFNKLLGSNNVAVVEPNEWHYYQPGWTLTAGGLKSAESMRKEQKTLVQNGVDWFKTKAQKFDPNNNRVTLASGETIKYDYLILATGIKINFDAVR
jgi:NADH dehydrogenase FAD-containing subunit